ncbi:unnamed protein product, partial [Notodromas monacha]
RRLKYCFDQVHGIKHFGSLSGCFLHMVSEGGKRSLWRGNGVNVLKIAPESALKFMAYEQAKRQIRGDSQLELRLWERFLAGAFAGALSQSAIYPLEVLKTRLALGTTGEYHGIFDAIRKIRRVEGIRSFYRGYFPNLLGILPYAGIELAVYETLKAEFIPPNKTEPGILLSLLCATASSTCGQVCAYPFALIRTKLQAQAVLFPNGKLRKRPTTTLAVVKTILQYEGWRGLYRGLLPNFLKVIPAVSISYAVYEKTRAALGVTMT